MDEFHNSAWKKLAQKNIFWMILFICFKNKNLYGEKRQDTGYLCEGSNQNRRSWNFQDAGNAVEISKMLEMLYFLICVLVIWFIYLVKIYQDVYTYNLHTILMYIYFI